MAGTVRTRMGGTLIQEYAVMSQFDQNGHIHLRLMMLLMVLLHVLHSSRQSFELENLDSNIAHVTV